MKSIVTHISEVPTVRLVEFERRRERPSDYPSADAKRERRAEACQLERLSQRQGYTASGSGVVAPLSYRHQLARAGLLPVITTKTDPRTLQRRRKQP